MSSKIRTREARETQKTIRHMSDKELYKEYLNGVPYEAKQVFATESFRSLLEDRAKAACPKDGRYYSVTTVLDEDPGDEAAVAYTDGKASHINILTSMLNKVKTVWDYFLCLVYLRLHEQAHVLYTDFEENNGVSKRILTGKPSAEEISVAPKVCAFIAKSTVARPYIAEIWHTLQNCVEDGFVDFAIVLNRCPGQKESKDVIYKISEDPTWYKNAGNMPSDAKFIDLVLDWARYRQENFPKSAVKTDPAVKAFLQVKDVITEATRDKVCHNRTMAAWKLLEAVWDMIENEAQNNQNKQNSQGSNGSDQQQQSSSSSSSSESSGSSSGSQSGSESSKSSEKSEEESDGSGSDKSEKADGEEGSDKSEGKSSDKSDNKDKSEDGKSGQKDKTEKDESKGHGKAGESKSESKPSDKAMEEELKNLADKFGDESSEAENRQRGDSRPSASDANQKGDSGDSGDQSQESDQGSQEQASSEKQQMENELKHLQSEFSEERAANDMILKSLSCPEARPRESIDRGISLSVNRASEGRGFDIAHRKAMLDPVAKVLTRKCEAVLREITDESVTHGEYNGKFEANPIRMATDKRVFSKKKLPGELPRWAVGIVIDRSGSMSGGRAELAANVSYVIYETMAKLKFPCFVIGHSFRRGVTIESFADEKSPVDEGCRILNHNGATGGNRDGYAIRYAVKKLDRINADKKLLFVISDGAPSAYDGYDDAYGDCRHAILSAYKADQVPIVAALGSAAENIKVVYTEGVKKKEQPLVLDCSDPNVMSRALIKILKRNICQEA